MADKGPKRRYGTTITFHFSKEMRDRLAELAEQEDRTLSSYLRIVLKKHVEEHKGGE